jgi:ketosteroid isomerase-like protein
VVCLYNGIMTSTPSTRTEQPAVDQTLRFAVGGRFIDGIGARDFNAVVGTLTDDVTFRALLPTRTIDRHGCDAVRATFDAWFGAAERWELIEAVVGEVGGRVHLRWRLRLTNPDVGQGSFVVEQQIYADTGPDGRMTNVALLCTGYLREAS